MPHAIYTIVHTQKKRNCKVPDKKIREEKMKIKTHHYIMTLNLNLFASQFLAL